MKNYFYIVYVTAEDKEKADKVMTEKFGHDEDLGFEYEIDWDSWK